MKYALALISSIFLFSCSKNEIPMPCESEQAKNFEFPMSIGSYWVYDLTRVSEIDTTYIKTDTLFVTGEEWIDDELYTSFSTLVPFPGYLSKSGIQLFTPNNLWAEFKLGENIILSADTLFSGDQPFLTSYGYMSPDLENISVPNGDFSCFHRLAEYTAVDPDYPHGMRTDNYFIAEGVGVVQFNYFFYSSPDYFYYSLVDYHLE